MYQVWALIGLCFYLFTIPVLGQSPQLIEKLSQELQLHREKDTARVDLLNQLSFAYWNNNPSITDSLAKEALVLSEELNYLHGKGEAWRCMSISLWMRAKHEEAFQMASKARALYENVNNQAGLATIYGMLGLIKDDIDDYESAIKYHQLSIQKHEELGAKAGVAKGLNNMAGVYYRLDSFALCKALFERSLVIRQELGIKHGIKESLSNLSYTHRQLGNLDTALVYIQQAIPIAEQLNDKVGIVTAYLSLAEINLDLGKLDSAEIIALDILPKARSLDVPKRVIEVLELLYKVKEAKGAYQSALGYYIKYNELRDSIVNEATAAQITRLEKSYETEKQEKEISQLQQEKQNQKILRNIFAFGALAALFIALLIFRFYRFRQLKNQELLRAKEEQAGQLEEINRIKSRFFANISHEFRTPLTLILGPIEQLKDRIKDSEQIGLLEMMKRNSQGLLKLINQLLDLSKLEAGKLELKASLLDIIPLLKGWVMAFHSIAEQKNIQLNFISQAPQYLLYIEKHKIEQVITNLLSNAFKFTPEGGRIEVKIKELVVGGQKHLEIIVCDSGKGIAKEELPYVFDYFFQASNVPQEDSLGTGIGLSLVKEFVELHKGKIKVETELGQGSQFILHLPMGKGHLTTSEINYLATNNATPIVNTQKISPPSIIAASEDDASEKSSILLIEDNPDLRLYIKNILELDYQVLLAADGEEGIAIALAEMPDLIVSDVMMPKKDGFEVCNYLKQDIRTSHIPIILLTAKDSQEDRLRGFENLADEYLAKPFDQDELLFRIHNLIEIRAQIQAHFNTKEILKPTTIKVNSMDQQFLSDLKEIVESHLDDPGFGVEQLADEIALSRSQLHRKLKSITSFTPIQFIRFFRLQRAKSLLEQQSASVTEIAMQVGFNNPSYFAKVFNEEFGIAPSEMLKAKV